ncbi:class IV adenylate cyclase [Streptococcus australis]|nr:class IV adenylate cyclase [Streptococcus australis]
MSSNIEFKAKLNNRNLAKNIIIKYSQANPEILKQRDIFYNFKLGRLKMRTINNSESELIFYIRQNIAGRKVSKYKRIKVKNPRLVDSMLSTLLGKIGEVKKSRTLYLKENIRFHLDEVAGLGNFIEVEYILPKDETRQSAEKKVDDIIKMLKIKKKDFIDISYMDMINKSR